jgi:hypothetical protein
MSTIDDIEIKAKALAAARAELADRVGRIRDEQDAIKRRLLTGVRNALARARDAYDELHALVESAPELFEKPRTRTLHGVRLGFMKQRGKLEWDDDRALIDALRKLLGEEAEGLIRTTEKPIAARLQDLPARDLRRLGVRVADDTDVVVIKTADDALDKFIDALIGDDRIEEVVS